MLLNSIVKISSGGLDTSDATASANDLVKNKTAYSKGIKITGTLEEVLANNTSTFNFGNFEDKQDYSQILISMIPVNDIIMRKDSIGQCYVDYKKLSDFLQITASKLLFGESILGINGSATEDGTILESDITKDKVGYSKGQKIIGTLDEIKLGVSQYFDSANIESINMADYPESGGSGNGYKFNIYNNTKDLILRTGSNPYIIKSQSSLRNDLEITDSDSIKYGVNILGLAGTFTSDGTITSEVIPQGLIGYSKGNQIVGTVKVSEEGSLEDLNYDSITENEDNLDIKGSFTETKFIKASGIGKTFAHILVALDKISNILGLTADKIKVNEKIGKITGTFTSDGTAIADDLLKDKIAYVNGQKIVGTATFGLDTSDATATAETIIKGKIAYAKGQRIVGTLELEFDEESLISKAY